MRGKIAAAVALSVIVSSCASVSAVSKRDWSRLPASEFIEYQPPKVSVPDAPDFMKPHRAVVKVAPKAVKRPRTAAKPKRVYRPVYAVSTAQKYALAVLGPTQYQCIYQLFNRESGWRVSAQNASGAYGIPQALPGSKMSVFGSDWATNPITQVKWGIYYVNHRYGSSCGAWYFWQGHGWY